MKQYQSQEKCYPDSMQIELKMSHTDTSIQNIAQLATSFRTTTPTKDTLEE